MLKLRGVLCPLATPFDHRGDLYSTKIRHNISRIELTKVTGFVVGSRWGEGPLLSSADRRRLWDEVGAASDGDRTLIADVSADGSAEAGALCRAAQEAGCQAVWLASHLAYAVTAGVQVSHFRAVADASPLPVIVEASADELTAEEASKLSAHPNIAAICSRSTPLEQLADLLGQDGCQTLTSNVNGVVEALAGGVNAAVLPLANALPFHLVSIEEAVRMRETEAAQDLENRLGGIDAALGRYGVPGLKQAMDLRGYFGGTPRLPLTPLGPEVQAEISDALDGLQS